MCVLEKVSNPTHDRKGVRMTVNLILRDFIYLRVCLCVCVCAHGQGLTEVRRAGVTRGCEPPDVGAGNQIQVLCNNSKCS